MKPRRNKRFLNFAIWGHSLSPKVMLTLLLYTSGESRGSDVRIRNEIQHFSLSDLLPRFMRLKMKWD